MTHFRALDSDETALVVSPIIQAAARSEGWTAAVPGAADVPDLFDLLRRHEQAARGGSSASQADVDTEVAGPGAATRGNLIIRDDSGQARGWATVHDRAAGRVIVAVAIDPELDDAAADRLAALLFGWVADAAAAVAAERGLDITQIDSGAFADDQRQQRWLATAGFALVRTWWQMSRPVEPTEAEPGVVAEPGEGVVVRIVERVGSEMPERADLVAVHDILETSFTDHFNFHEETFEEFCSRLREDPGHRWNHWWIAEIVDDADKPAEPAGALIATASPGSEGESGGTYVSYLGVLQSARGRGLATSLLNAVMVDAAKRKLDWVGLEVDQDSPTGAADLYTSLGFVTSYRTQSWHRDVPTIPCGGTV
jgi:ribosomal protein S18 acetylase RimI-like enzyme